MQHVQSLSVDVDDLADAHGMGLQLLFDFLLNCGKIFSGNQDLEVNFVVFF